MAFTVAVALALAAAALGTALAASPPVAVPDGVTTRTARLVPFDGGGADQFGYAVAVSGNTAVVGSYRNDNAKGTDAGAAYVYTRSGSTWAYQAKLIPAQGQAYDWFGWSVAIDGDVAVVGSRYFGSRSVHSGAAYVFRRSGVVWSQEATLLPTSPAPAQIFGYSVAISGDRAVVGAPWHDAAGPQSGAAVVFVRQGGVWSQEALLTPSDGSRDDRFGNSVGLFGDTAVVGSPYHDAGPADSGAAYVFTRSGPTWSQRRELFLVDASASDGLGYSVSLSGGTVIAGAPWRDDVGADSGAAYVFTGSGSTWSTQAEVGPFDGRRNAWFGYSVALQGDRAVVGAPAHDRFGVNSGAAYALSRQGSTWRQGAIDCAGLDPGDAFGRSVGVSGDDGVVGAFGDDGASSDLGAAYAFQGLSPYGVAEDTTLTITPPGVLGNDTDPDGDPLQAELVTQSTRGWVSLALDGSFMYVPDPDYFGPDTFTYRAFDGFLYSTPTTVTIAVSSVNDPPVSREDTTYATDEDVPFGVAALAGVLANDLDVEGDTLTAQLVTTTAKGSLSLASDGSFTYTPSPDSNGADRFWYRAFDGVDPSAVATVTITVRAVNDAPRVTAAPIVLEGNAPGGYVGPLGVGVTVVDVDDATATVNVTHDAPALLPLGPNTVTWIATDPQGATGTAAQSVTVTDTVPPTDPTAACTSHATGTPTSNRYVDVTWGGATDTCSGLGGYSLSFSRGATERPDTVIDAGPSVTATTSPALADGAWWFNLRTADVAGNWTSTVHLGPYVVDTRPPVTGVSTSPPSPDGQAGWYKSVPSVALTPDESATTVFRWNGGSWQSYATTLAAAEGTHTLECFSVDSAGNTETAFARVFRADTGKPSDPTLSSPSHALGVPSGDGSIVIELSGATDAVSGVGGFSVSFSQGTTEQPDATIDLGPAADATTSPVLADGAWWFNLRTADVAGNWTGTAHLGPFIIDTAPPGPVGGLTATAFPQRVRLGWSPPATDFAGVRILRSADGFASAPTETAGQTNVYEGTGATHEDTGLANGTTYHYTAFTRDAAGNWSEAATTAATPSQWPASLTLGRGPRWVVGYGEVVTLYGGLHSDETSSVSGRVIAIYRRAFGDRAWYWEGSTVTAADGSWELPVRLGENSHFRADFAGDDELTDATSEGVWVRCRARLYTPSIPVLNRSGGVVTVRGYLAPAHSGWTRLLFYRRVNGVWRFWRAHEASNVRLGGYSRYVLKTRLISRGRWYVRAYHGDLDHHRTFSRPRLFWVR